MIVDPYRRVGSSVAFARDWNDNSTADQTLYGFFTPVHSASGGQYHLRTTGAASAASGLDLSPSLVDFTATLDVSAYSAERSGLIYRTPTSVFVANAAVNFGFYYSASVTNTAVYFMVGPTVLTSYTFPTPYTNGAIVALKVVASANVHLIYVDGVLCITASDFAYDTVAGNFGLLSVLSATDSIFDNLVIT